MKTTTIEHAGSQQNNGCGPDASHALGPERLQRLCQGECYNPTVVRRPITRIEVIRIKPQRSAGEAIVGLVEDPWKVIPCDGDPEGCVGTDQFECWVKGGLPHTRGKEDPESMYTISTILLL